MPRQPSLPALIDEGYDANHHELKRKRFAGGPAVRTSRAPTAPTGTDKQGRSTKTPLTTSTPSDMPICPPSTETPASGSLAS